MSSEKRTSFLIFSALVLLPLIAFGQSIAFDWVKWDDPMNVYENPWLNPPKWDSLKRFWEAPYFHLYMPVTYSLWLLLAVPAHLPQAAKSNGAGTYTLDPHIYHGAGLALHVFNVFLVFFLFRRFVKSDISAAFGALFFGLHPVQVESVCWVTGMNNVFSGTFALLSLHQYVCFLQSGRAKKHHYFWSVLCCALALLAKPTSVTLPLMALVLAMIAEPTQETTRAQSENKAGAKKYLLELLPWFILAFVCVVFTRSAQTIEDAAPYSPLWQRPFLILDSISFYVKKTVFPNILGIDYGRTSAIIFQEAKQGYALWWLLPVGLTALLWRKRRSWPLLWGSWLLFIIYLLPTSGITPFYFHAMSLVADRYLYLALLGPALALTWWIDNISARPRFYAGLYLSFLCLWSAVVSVSWSNSFSLFEHALNVNPRSWMAHIGYGSALLHMDKSDEAMVHFQKAIDVNPTNVSANYSYGLALLSKGDHDGARQYWHRALELNPQDYKTQSALQNLDKMEKDPHAKIEIR